MIFKLELSPQNFHYDVLYPLYSVRDVTNCFKFCVTFLYSQFLVGSKGQCRIDRARAGLFQSCQMQTQTQGAKFALFWLFSQFNPLICTSIEQSGWLCFKQKDKILFEGKFKFVYKYILNRSLPEINTVVVHTINSKMFCENIQIKRFPLKIIYFGPFRTKLTGVLPPD